MRKSKKLSFTDERKKNSKRIRSFIIAFCAFVVVLGAVSLIMFMKHLNFDLSNLLSSAETTTAEAQQTTTEPVALEGGSDILLICENSVGQLDFVLLVSTDFETRHMTVSPIDADSMSSVNSDSGVLAVRDAAALSTGTEIDRYIKFSTSHFRSFLNKFEDVTVNVENDIDDSANGLILDKGEQSLSAELFIKYMNYSDSYHKADAFAQLLKIVFSPKHVNAQESLFSYIANNSQTDLSIVDYKEHQERLEEFSRSGGVIAAAEPSEQAEG